MTDYKELPCRRCGRVWMWAFDKKSVPYCPDGHGCTVSVEKEKEMNVIDLLTKALNTEATWDLLDNVVILRLKESRDLFVKERERLDNIAKNRELQAHEHEDWTSLVQDIVALNRVMEIYGVYND